MEQLISLFTQLYGVQPSIQLLKGEGSNRKYYRLTTSETIPNTSLIGVIGESKEENHTFISLANHFSKIGLNTPKVECASADEMCYLQEDLGDLSLFNAIKPCIDAHNFDDDAICLLEKAIEKLADFQFNAAKGLDFSVCYPIPSMDRTSILWDLNYFKYCFLKPSHIDFSEPHLEQDFQHLADKILCFDSHSFLYRDFQSRNIMLKWEKDKEKSKTRNLKDATPYFIDFQGGRKGPFYYDVASFIWQAKANYPTEVKNILIKSYVKSLNKYFSIDEESFTKNLQLFVLFRQLQVLGAYGYRGLFERKTHFIESIPFALKNIAELLKNNDFSEFPYLVGLLERLSAQPCADNTSEIVLHNTKTANHKEEGKKEEEPDPSKLTVRVFSFSYKKGIPEDISGNGGGYVFDCRGVHNPGRYNEYKTLTGTDQPVIDFLEANGEITQFLDSVYKLADAHVARYIRRGFSSLMFSFGCTGGQHRSVYSAQHTAEHISKKFGVRVELCHREQNITQVFPFSK